MQVSITESSVCTAHLCCPGTLGPLNANAPQRARLVLSLQDVQQRLHYCSCAGLLTLQLAITAAVTAVFCLSTPVKTFVWSNPWTFWTPFAASLALVLVLSCSESARRSHPTNIIVLLLFTGCEAVLVGTISAMYDTQVVLLAAVMTVGITACLTLYALQTKRDFTAAGG